jgi:hypothetical protein
VATGLRRLHNEELHNLCTAPNIIRVTKSRRMREAEHVACMGDINTCEDYSEDLRVDGRIILGCISGK